jgi:hypothetical protein
MSGNGLRAGGSPAAGSGRPLRIGMIGLDNSRVVAFAKLLNDPAHPEHIPGASIVAAWPGTASADFPMSVLRLDGYLAQLRDLYGVEMLETMESVAARCDAWMLEAVDGRVHEALFERMVAYRKPIFVDKPFALDSGAAERMMRLAWEFETPFMSCSALRYADSLTGVLAAEAEGSTTGADFYGPMELEPTQPGYFWYGIHTADMLFRALGTGCIEVSASRTEEHDFVVGKWRDGRIGTIRGYRTGNEGFGGLIHGRTGSRAVELGVSGKSYFTSLMEEVIVFFRTGLAPIDPRETLEIVRFLESANESIRQEKAIRLN